MIRFDPSLRARLAAGSSREVLTSAFRIRAGMIGALQSCLCTYGITEQHDPACPATAILESQRRAMEAGG